MRNNGTLLHMTSLDRSVHIDLKGFPGIINDTRIHDFLMNL